MSDRRSFIQKLGALIAGAAVAKQLPAETPKQKGEVIIGHGLTLEVDGQRVFPNSHLGVRSVEFIGGFRNGTVTVDGHRIVDARSVKCYDIDHAIANSSFRGEVVSFSPCYELKDIRSSVDVTGLQSWTYQGLVRVSKWPKGTPQSYRKWLDL